jgi:hypothetical protein
VRSIRAADWGSRKRRGGSADTCWSLWSRGRRCIGFGRGGLLTAGVLLAIFYTAIVLPRVGTSREQGAWLAQAKGAHWDAWRLAAEQRGFPP